VGISRKGGWRYPWKQLESKKREGKGEQTEPVEKEARLCGYDSLKVNTSKGKVAYVLGLREEAEEERKKTDQFRSKKSV